MSTNQPKDSFLPMTTHQAAEYLGISRSTLLQHIHRGLIKTHKPGRDHFITKGECDRFAKHKRPRGNPNFQKKEPVRRRAS